MRLTLRVLHFDIKFNMFNIIFRMQFIALFMLLVPFLCKGVSAQPVPLLRAHAHNDYEHDRPLFEALERGFSSIEADIFLIGDQLLVAHDIEDVNPEKTLQGLYLDPLQNHIASNDGQVYPGAPPLILLIDIKSEALSTYRALHDVLKNYKDMLTRFEEGTIHSGAVTAIISGNRPREFMKSQKVRWAAYDGRLEDLGMDNPEPISFIPLVSSNWNNISSWYGAGEINANDRDKLKDTVELAHAEGRLIRFWATSNNPKVWETLYEAGVDLLNADDLEGLQRLLLSK